MFTAHLQTGDDFQKHMIKYIRENFADLLGPHEHLLDEDGGLDKLIDLVRSGAIRPSI